jgi:hypothetical protein
MASIATARAKVLGRTIGAAMARDAKAEGMPREWTGLDAQDGDRAIADGVMPDTPLWEEMERAAKEEFESRVKELSQ